MLQNNVHINNTHLNNNTKHNKKSTLLIPGEINSEEVQDIMCKMPSRMVRQGTGILFVVIALLFVGAYFIQYPDIIVTNVNIVSANPPVKVVAQTNARIQRLFIQNDETIKENESICLLENPADYNNMLTLKTFLDRLDTTTDIFRSATDILHAESLQVGELQPGYAELYQSLHDYSFFIEKNFIAHKVAQLQSQVKYQDDLNKELHNRDTLLKQQLRLEAKKFATDSMLAKEKVLAPLELDNSKKELINKQLNADAIRSGLIENKLQQSEYIKTISELQQQETQYENDLQQKIFEDVKKLRAQWQMWQQKYLIKSPVTGKAVFFNVWKENQYVNANDPILMVVPPVQQYVVKASLPIDGAGKVKADQKVLIKLSAYPYNEFGMLQGKVKHISTVALDTSFALEMTLQKGMVTTANKQIPIQPQLTGLAEIVTDNKNILTRVFEKIYAR